VFNCDEEIVLCDFGGCSVDPDIDNDFVIDGLELGDIDAPQDSDGDGTPDYADPDDDGDQLTSAWENDPRTVGCQLSLDPDEVGLIAVSVDYYYEGRYWRFECIDQLGYTLVFDFGGNDLANYPNLDAPGTPLVENPDNTPNFLDTDDDGDGDDTLVEGMGDIDGDGVPNGYDPYDHDGPLADPDQDGLVTEVEVGLGTQPYEEDTDDDRIPDGIEVADVAAPLNNDGDGLIDALDPDDDNDGIDTAVEGTLDLDRDGAPNYLDLDSDGDGISDAEEGASSDADCDGLFDAFDADDGDGPCLGGPVVQPGLSYVNQGCSCSSSVDGGAALGWAGLAALLIGARRRVVASRHPPAPRPLPRDTVGR
jgi:uncharacterized protein (TIGR03382 family)